MKKDAVVARERELLAEWEESLKLNSSILETNKVFISGRIDSEFEYSHELHGRKYYRTRVRVSRTSGVEDVIPIIVADTIIGSMLNRQQTGNYCEVSGQFRSRSELDAENNKRHINLRVYVTAIKIYETEEPEETTDINLIYLDGYICKPTIFRVTPKGKDITDAIIAVNRSSRLSDYIPCIMWKKIAKIFSTFEVGDHVKIYGRIQSREYVKNTDKGAESKIAYEVLVVRFKKEE